MSFAELDSVTLHAGPEVGPSVWPVAVPRWLAVVSGGHAIMSQNRTLLALIVVAHLVAISLLLSRTGLLQISLPDEQSRLVLFQVAPTVQVERKKEPEAPSAPAEDQQHIFGVQVAMIEWTRVANWRPRGSGTVAAVGGGEDDFDATRLLAGMGATGPAGREQGVDDPYAGASPVWAQDDPARSLLLRDAPNPAVLEQVRQRVAMTFRGLRGFARIAVMVDKDGVVVSISEFETDLPISSRSLVEQSLLGRVVSRPSRPGMLQLPKIYF